MMSVPSSVYVFPAVSLFPVWNTKSLFLWKPAQGGPVASCLSFSQYGSSQFLSVPWTLPRLSLSLLLTLTVEIMSFQVNLSSILSFFWWPSYLRCKPWDFTHLTQDPPIYCPLSVCGLVLNFSIVISSFSSFISLYEEFPSPLLLFVCLILWLWSRPERLHSQSGMRTAGLLESGGRGQEVEDFLECAFFPTLVQ